LPPQTVPIEAGIWQDYVGSPGAQLRVLRAGAASARPVLVQHGAQSGAGACEPLLAGLAATRAVYAVELPGHGFSDDGPHGPDPEIEELAGRVRVVMRDLGLDGCDCVGIGAGGPIVVELQHLVKLDAARRHAPMSRVHSLLIAPIDLSGDTMLRETLAHSYVGAPIDSHGGYLLKAWHEVRDHRLFFPWFERCRAYGLAAEPALAPESLQAQTVAHVLSGASGIALRRREARYRLLERLRTCDVNPDFAAPASCPRFPHTRGLTHDTSSFLALPASMADWPGALLARIDG
jgi:pimeloyl-ACP methyl ester carboxylesterase